MTTYAAVSTDQAATVLATGTLYTVAMLLAREPSSRLARADGTCLNDEEIHALNLVFQAMGVSRRETPSRPQTPSSTADAGPVPIDDI